MADYSHLRALSPTLKWIADYRRQGLPLYDEMLIEAIDLMVAPLLPGYAMGALRREIDPAVSRRRGRPRKDEPSAKQLVDLIKAQDRPDIPSEIIDSLISRLESGKPYTERDWKIEQVIKRRAYDRELLISGVYRGLYNMLEAGPARVREVFGDINLGLHFEDLSRHEQATVATGAVMHSEYLMNMPGPRRIANIVSRRKMPKPMCVNFT